MNQNHGIFCSLFMIHILNNPINYYFTQNNLRTNTPSFRQEKFFLFARPCRNVINDKKFLYKESPMVHCRALQPSLQ